MQYLGVYHFKRFNYDLLNQRLPSIHLLGTR